MVIGDRQTQAIAHFSGLKRYLQSLGSRVIGRLAGLQVPDVASGFRAFSRECAIQLSTFTNFDHTAEHVIEAGYKNLAVTSVAIRTNPKTRESRLFSNIGKFVFKSGEISLRTYARYVALKIFALCGILTFAAGFCLGVRFLYFFFFTDEGMLHVQVAYLGGDSAVGRVSDVSHRRHRRLDRHQSGLARRCACSGSRSWNCAIRGKIILPDEKTCDLHRRPRGDDRAAHSPDASRARGCGGAAHSTGAAPGSTSAG